MILFEGYLTNPNEPNSRLTYYDVAISDASGGFICRTRTDAEGRYVCGGQTTLFSSFDATYAIQGSKGSTTLTANVAAGVAGSTTRVSHPLEFPLPTIFLHGSVTDGTEPIAGANVLFERKTYLTESDGTYGALLHLRARHYRNRHLPQGKRRLERADPSVYR